MDESLYTSQKDENRENIKPRKACFEDEIKMVVKRTPMQPLPITDFSDHAERRKVYVSKEPPDETFAEQGIEKVGRYYRTAKPVIVSTPTPQPVSVSPVASPNPVTNNVPSTPVYQATEDDVNAQVQAQIDAQKAAVAEAQRLAALQEAQRLQAIEDQKAAEAKRKRLAEKASVAEAERLAALQEAQRLQAIEDQKVGMDAEAQRLAALREAQRLQAVAEAQRLAALQEAQRLQAIEDQKAAEAKRKRLADEAFYKSGVDERSADEPFYKAGVDAEAADKAIAEHELTLKDAEQQQAQIVAEKASVIIAQVSEALKRETNEENIKLLQQQKTEAENVKAEAEKIIKRGDIFDRIARWIIKTMNL